MSTARNTFLSLSCFFLIVAGSTAIFDFDYYSKYTNCHDAEDIVKGVVDDYVQKNPGLGAGLIRMFFHDCFVRGCDASILLNTSSLNPDPERFAIPNFPSLRGFEVIDAAKSKLEEKCPGVVSCADIIAFAARDASFFLSNMKVPYYKVQAGRLDGRISIKDEVLPALPAPFHNVVTQKALFAAKGLSPLDLVTLQGAHSIGRSHCSSFTSRLYPNIDPTMDQGFGLGLRNECPQNAISDGVVVLDFVTPNILDKQYYQNVRDLKALFFSDWSLLTNNDTFLILEDYRLLPGKFELMFAESMQKMGNIDVKTGTQGEIRRSCSAVNDPTTMAPPPVNYPPTKAPPPPTKAPPPVNYPPTKAPPPPTKAPPPVNYPPTKAPPPVNYPPTKAPPPYPTY